jgi:OPA family sugar phosphate sensor protein UhpC-like MFS transporter
MYLGYAFYYFTRQSFTCAIPVLQADLGFSKMELGLIGSALSLSYGLSKFVNGILVDKANLPRIFMSFGLIFTGILNICFGCASTVWMMMLLWGLNGYFQGWGWPSCTKLLTHWYAQSERGRWWGVWNTCLNVGGISIPILVGFLSYHFGWRVALYVPGTICIVAGFFLLFLLRNTPESLGLPPIEVSPTRSQESTLSVREILFKYVLQNPFVWMLSFAYLLIYFIRIGITHWSMLYLVETRSYTTFEAGFCISAFECGGFFGSLTAGWASDLLFQARRNPINCLFSFMVALLLLGFKLIAGSSIFLDATFLFLLGFFVFGPQMMIGMAVAELTHKKAAATANGFAGFFAYCLGATLACGPLGKLIDAWGWNGYLLTLFFSAVGATLLVLPLWSVKQYTKDFEHAVS